MRSDTVLKLAVIVLSIFLSGCSTTPKISEQGVEITKDTHASIDDVGVGRVTNKF